MEKKIGVGMIGCGGMGRILAKMLAQKSPQLEIRGIFDPDPKSIASTLKDVSPSARVYKSYQSLVKSPEIDWVLIASWNCFHKAQTIAALRAGKDVFCQKPLATTFKNALAMNDAWKASGRMFLIGFTLRYSPHYRKIKELLASGAIGKIVSMEFNETLGFTHGAYIMGDWRRLQKYAGTHLLEKCCHDIDLVHWMMESLPTRVASFGGLNFFRPENAYHADRLAPHESGIKAYLVDHMKENPFTSEKDIIDNQVAIIEFANGARATFHTNCNAGILERRMYILGTEGAIRANVLTGEFELQRIGFDTEREKIDTGSKGGHGGGDDIMASELAESMIERKPPKAGMAEGLASSIACFAIDKAMETGRVVDLNPYWDKAGLR